VTLAAGTVAAKCAKHYGNKEVKPRKEGFSNWLLKCIHEERRVS